MFPFKDSLETCNTSGPVNLFFNLFWHKICNYSTDKELRIEGFSKAPTTVTLVCFITRRFMPSGVSFKSLQSYFVLAGNSPLGNRPKTKIYQIIWQFKIFIALFSLLSSDILFYIIGLFSPSLPYYKLTYLFAKIQ